MKKNVLKGSLIAIVLLIVTICGLFVYSEKISKIEVIENAKLQKDLKGQQYISGIISTEDVGKKIKIKVTIGGEEFDNWSIFMNVDSRIFLIMDEYLPTRLIPDSWGLKKVDEYAVSWGNNTDLSYPWYKNEDELKLIFNDEIIESVFLTPHVANVIDPYNVKYNTNYNWAKRPILLDPSTNQVAKPYVIDTDNIYDGYWFCGGASGGSRPYMKNNGTIELTSNYQTESRPVRPVILLKDDVTTDNVEIEGMLKLTINPNGGLWNDTTEKSSRLVRENEEFTIELPKRERLCLFRLGIF